MANKNKNNNKKNNAKKRKTNKSNSYKRIDIVEVPLFWVGIVILTAFYVLLMLSLFGLCKDVGSFLSNILFGISGLVAYIVPIGLFLSTFFMIANRKEKIYYLKLLFAFFMLIDINGFIALISEGNAFESIAHSYIIGSSKHTGGGAIGGIVLKLFLSHMGIVGTSVLLIALFIVFSILIFDKGVTRLLHNIKKKSELRDLRRSMTPPVIEDTSSTKRSRTNDKTSNRPRNINGVSYDTKIVPKDVGNDNMKEIFSDIPFIEEENLQPAKPIQTTNDEVINEAVPSKTKKEENPPKRTIRKAEPKKDVVEVEKSQKDNKQIDIESEIKEPSSDSNYEFPPIDLLKKGNGKSSGDSKETLNEIADKLEQTLQNFGVNVKVTDVSCGPSVTRYELQPEQGVKVSKIVGLADDIKLNLAAADIRIEAPIPGKAAVGIEVPNKENVTVPLRDLIESNEFAGINTKIPFPAGKDIAGEIVVSDIAKMPHVLIAGSTGSGKSVCINTIVMSILYKARPDEVRLIMIDPKVVELSVYNGIPHLMIPVVTDPKKAAGALNWAVAEMTERYKRFAEEEVRDLKGYNEKMRAKNEFDSKDILPQIVIIVDELADLMMVAPGDVEDAICRLAQLARACGIHLILATQRPSVNVITGLIKANMPSRVAFAVSSGVDSRTILDMNGAEKLLGKGDMLFYPQGYQKPLRVQGCFVSDSEVTKVVEYLKSKTPRSNDDNNEIQDKIANYSISEKTMAKSGGAETDDGRDVYFEDAARLIVDKERASIGSMQRAFKIGFNRAARIMDQLEEAGIVGPEEGTKPRKILISKEELELMMESLED